MHVNISRGREEIEGTAERSLMDPLGSNTDELTTHGEELRLIQTGMRFGRQEYNIILKANQLSIVPIDTSFGQARDIYDCCAICEIPCSTQ